ncbi:DUF6222 family protein [Actinophytocola sp.]|uniref:DUF6222 family protein n=1 Tax=Actinophytocola sp. TaxID=1872138 RepID=UPI002ED19F5C
MSTFDSPSLVPEHNAPPVNLEELVRPTPSATLARGIVWADILAEIAADEEARQRRRATETWQQLPEAA